MLHHPIFITGAGCASGGETCDEAFSFPGSSCLRRRLRSVFPGCGHNRLRVFKNPQSFNGKIVRIKGTVVAGFDQFVLKGRPSAAGTDKNIWLAYPEGTKAKAGPAAVVQVQPAHNFAGDVTPLRRGRR